jgi:hypothetical protein
MTHMYIYISYSQYAGQLVCAQQFHQVYVCLIKKKWTWWPVSAGAVYCAMQFEAINSGQNKKLWQNTREIMPQSYEFSFARPKLHQLQGQSDTTCMQSMSSPETHCRGHPEQSKVLRDGAAVPKMLLRSN